MVCPCQWFPCLSKLKRVCSVDRHQTVLDLVPILVFSLISVDGNNWHCHISLLEINIDLIYNAFQGSCDSPACLSDLPFDIFPVQYSIYDCVYLAFKIL